MRAISLLFVVIALAGCASASVRGVERSPPAAEGRSMRESGWGGALTGALPPTPVPFPSVLSEPVDVSPAAVARRHGDIDDIRRLMSRVRGEGQAELVARLALLYHAEAVAERAANRARKAAMLEQQAGQNLIILVESFPEAQATAALLVDASVALVAAGRMDAALALLQQVRLGQGPEAPRALLALGDLAFARGEHASAATLYEEACRDDGDRVVCRYANARRAQLPAPATSSGEPAPAGAAVAP